MTAASEPTWYCVVRWCVEDIKSLRPGWSDERCEEFLQCHERRMAERMTELGWDVIECYLADEPDNFRCAYRFGSYPNVRFNIRGFRLSAALK